jgi:hypothetical protein
VFDGYRGCCIGVGFTNGCGVEGCSFVGTIVVVKVVSSNRILYMTMIENNVYVKVLGRGACFSSSRLLCSIYSQCPLQDNEPHFHRDLMNS